MQDLANGAVLSILQLSNPPRILYNGAALPLAQVKEPNARS